MDGDNVDDLTFADSPPAKKSVRQGRRAAAVTEDDEYQDLDIGGSPLRNRPKTGDILLLEDEGPRRPRASAPARRTGGWGEEARARSARTARPGTTRTVRGEESEEEDPVIPDLDDVEQEDFALTVADAPSVAVNRVATYTELDNDMFKHAAFSTLEEIDLRFRFDPPRLIMSSCHHKFRVLTRCLETEASLLEADESWQWETLFTELAASLNTQWLPEPEEGERVAASERPYTAFNRFPV